MRNGILAGLFLLVGVSAVSQADEWRKQFAVSAKPEVAVEMNDGNIRVSSSDQPQVQATVLTRGWKISPSDVRVDARQSGNRIDIEVHVPHMTFSWGNRSVDLELVVPRESDLMLNTKDGNVTLDGVRGTEKVHSGDGNIEARRLEDAVTVSTGDGNINLDGRFDLLDANTGDGNIDADAAGGSKMSTAWTLRTGDGNIRLRVPSSFSADLDAETGDGAVSVEFPVTVAGRQDENKLRAPINGGGPTLRLRTGDGQIRIEKGGAGI